MAFPWAPLISAGAGLLGKIFGGDDEQKTTSEIDYVKLRENAERAGFNPLTALRAGGGAGFTTTHHPALASGSYIADAVGGIADAIAQIDPMRDATAKLEYELKQATLANLQADTAQRLNATRAIGGVPVSTGARNVAVISPLAAGLPLSPTVETPTLTNPYSVQSGIPVDPNIPDAAAAEERYGDVAGSVWGIGVGFYDWLYGVRNSTVPKGYSEQKFYAPGLARKPVKARDSAPWRPPSLPSSRGW